ncbi:hypothetical protein RB195_006769 [Necator americanus]|uniref:Serine/threonine specific protein phosphatases domain-containing protein n=1 Tax=Necator americanus TaxID=51031 RepID=A0ABR1BU49_NECAM
MINLLWWFSLLAFGEIAVEFEVHELPDDEDSSSLTTTMLSTLSSTTQSEMSTNDSTLWSTTTSPTCTQNGCRSKTLTCKTNNGTQEDCGVCVLRQIYNRDRKAHGKPLNVSYHCQKYSNYPESAVNMCTDVKVHYPNMKIYKSEKFIYVKYCCRSSMCNQKMFTPLIPKFHIQTENVDQIYFDYFITCTEMMVVTFVAFWPLAIILKEGKKEKKLYAMLNQPMEPVILDSKSAPSMKTVAIPKRITGQLKFKELCRDLTNMELRMRKACIDFKEDAKPTYKKFEFRAGGNGHNIVKVDRFIMVSYESYILSQLIEHGPYLYEWTPFELVSLLSQAADIFEGESTMLTLRAPITVIGDIRGQYQDLYRWLTIAGFPPRQKVLFLGGVVDKEEAGSIDCLALIAAMKLRFPHDVFFIRGIGETLPIKFQPRFRRRNDSAIQSAATRLCNSLPIAARISNQILAVHSGLAHEISDYESITAIKRPFTLADMSSLARQLIFGQPTTKISMYRENPGKNSSIFGFGAINRVCHDMGVRLIIRSRNPLDDGICWLGKKQRMVSIWSAPAKQSNKGAILSICANFVIHVYTLEKQRSSKKGKSSDN